MQQNTINWTHNTGDFRFLYICHVKKFEINPHFSFLHMFHVQKFEISPHERFFLHGPVTNMRYALLMLIITFTFLVISIA